MNFPAVEIPLAQYTQFTFESNSQHILLCIIIRAELRFLSLNIHNLHLKAIHNYKQILDLLQHVEIPLAQYTQFTFESNSQL